MSSNDRNRIRRDQLTAALAALDVATVAAPDLTDYDAAVILAGGTAFRLADIATELTDSGDDIDSKAVRARFIRGWVDIRDSAGCDTSGEAALLSIITDLIGAVANNNATKRHNPYARAASFAMEAAAALLYLATDYDPENPVEDAARAGARTIADDRLTHAHAWLAHARSTS